MRLTVMTGLSDFRLSVSLGPTNVRKVQSFPAENSILVEVVIQAQQEDLLMSDHYWLSQAQLERIKPYFPTSHGMPRVDDWRVVSGTKPLQADTR